MKRALGFAASLLTAAGLTLIGVGAVSYNSTAVAGVPIVPVDGSCAPYDTKLMKCNTPEYCTGNTPKCPSGDSTCDCKMQ